jgi:ribosomal protein S18 acetylase RimI-like enzyme
MDSPQSRPATLDDVPGMAEALADAFHDDPVMAWLFGDDEARTQKPLRKFMAHEGRRHLKHPTVFTTDDHAGAAYWDPPGQWKTRFVDVAGMAPFMITGMRHRIVRALKGLGLIEKAHGRHPKHYYLAVLGTRTDHQGKGVGSALIQPILDRCDEEGMGAYLESSKEQNIPFYRRHGFEVVEVLHLPKGPDLWPMWRDPQPPA